MNDARSGELKAELGRQGLNAKRASVEALARRERASTL
jgi:hypothetical protein